MLGERFSLKTGVHCGEGMLVSILCHSRESSTIKAGIHIGEASNPGPACALDDPDADCGEAGFGYEDEQSEEPFISVGDIRAQMAEEYSRSLAAAEAVNDDLTDLQSGAVGGCC